MCLRLPVWAASEVGLSVDHKVAQDFSRFYSGERLRRMGFHFLALGVVAQTSIDENIQNWYQSRLRSERVDIFSGIAKLFGEGKALIPLSLMASGFNYFDSDSTIGHWGFKSLRAYVVGVLPLLLMQRVTGASRPGETKYGSKWFPFHDDNGVSGHAAVGAVPFLVLANMKGGRIWLKYFAYAASILAAWSRVNDDSHYFSQAVLGWYIAYESVDSVFDTRERNEGQLVRACINPVFYRLSFHIKW